MRARIEQVFAEQKDRMVLFSQTVGLAAQDLRPLARRIGVSIGRPTGFLRWTWLVKPFRTRNASFFRERYHLISWPLCLVICQAL